jgi:hypothetical protein
MGLSYALLEAADLDLKRVQSRAAVQT